MHFIKYSEARKIRYFHNLNNFWIHLAFSNKDSVIIKWFLFSRSSHSYQPWQRLSMAEFILETNYPSRRIVCQTDNSSKYKSEDEFWRGIFCLHIRYALRVLHDWCFAVEPSGSLARDQKQHGGTRSVDLNCSTVNSLTSISLAWNSFLNAFWISSNICTSEYFFSTKRSSTVAHPTCNHFLCIVDQI